MSIALYYDSGSPVIFNSITTITLSETHGAENSVTEQTLENGEKINDHIIVHPATIELKFLITNSEGGTALKNTEEAKTAWQTLKGIRNNRTLLIVDTIHELYRNMAIESLSGIHEAPYTGQLMFTIRMKQINYANVNTGKNTLAKMGS